MSAPTELLIERIQRVQKALAEKDNAPMLITDPSNVGWLSGVPVDFQKDAHILISPEDVIFITDGRYENRIPKIPGMGSFIWGADHPHRYPELRSLLVNTKQLTLDTRGLALDIYKVLPKMLEVDELDVPPGFIDRLRMIKGDLEIKLIREALEVAIHQFKYMVEEWLPKNLDSATDVDFREELDSLPLDYGADGVSFESIVAMDADADTPHPDLSRPPRPLQGGKMMLVDWGITYKGVCTDLTRMIMIGKEMPMIFQGMKLLQEKWMEAVIAEIQPGKPACDAGNAYWQGLKAAGIEKPFHGAGHGTGGAYVHELPVLSGMKEGVNDFGIPFRQGIILEPGMIVTSEPGMYEKNAGAYRTESMVLVTKDGHEILDKALPIDVFVV